jgi:hypothetical protein
MDSSITAEDIMYNLWLVMIILNLVCHIMTYLVNIIVFLLFRNACLNSLSSFSEIPTSNKSFCLTLFSQGKFSIRKICYVNRRVGWAK